MNTQKRRAQNFEKKFGPSARGQNGPLRAGKSTFWEFFYFWNNFRTNQGPQTRPCDLFPKTIVFGWQVVKAQFWSILGRILLEIDINEKPFVKTTCNSLYLTINTESLLKHRKERR